LFDEVLAEGVRLQSAVNSEMLLCYFSSWACGVLSPSLIHSPWGQSSLDINQVFYYCLWYRTGGAVAAVLNVFTIKMTMNF